MTQRGPRVALLVPRLGRCERVSVSIRAREGPMTKGGPSGPPLSLPLLGSNQDSSDPESDVLPVTPRGSYATPLRLLPALGTGYATYPEFPPSGNPSETP
jgi:hypothetical protein